MKKIIIILFMLNSFLWAKDFNLMYNKPEVTSMYHYYVVQTDREEIVSSLSDFEPNGYFLNKITSFMTYKTPQSFLFANYKFGLAFNRFDDDNYYQYFYGTTIKGNILDKILFFGNWWKVQFSKSVLETQSPLNDSWSEEKSVDNTNTIVQFRNDFYKFSFGRSKFEVGSNIGGSVILSDVADDYPFISSDFNFGKINISFLHTSLIPDSVSIYHDPYSSRDKKYDDKFMALHKIDWKNHGLHLFFGEEVIYGQRSMDFNYILPLAFWRAIEHDIGDRDNMLMFAGLDWTFKDNNIIYFNFNLDDLVKKKIFSNYWGNKYAVQLGYKKQINKNLSFTDEITAVRPWMYTHKRMINVFSHHENALGFPTGSNLIQNTFEVNYYFLKKAQLTINYAIAKQGSVGSDFTMNYLQVGDQKTATAKWLEGEISDIQKLALSLDINFLNYNNLHTALEINKKDDKTVTRISVQYQIKL